MHASIRAYLLRSETSNEGKCSSPSHGAFLFADWELGKWGVGLGPTDRRIWGRRLGKNRVGQIIESAVRRRNGIIATPMQPVLLSIVCYRLKATCGCGTPQPQEGGREEEGKGKSSGQGREPPAATRLTSVLLPRLVPLVRIIWYW